MPDYTKSKIYKLISPSGLVYIGSTTKSLVERKCGHRAAYEKYAEDNSRTYTRSFKLFEEGIDRVDIILIEEYNCNSKEELLKRERYYIESTECVNKNRPIVTKEEIKERVKKYYEENKERITEVKKLYEKKNSSKIRKYQNKYKEEHSDEIKEYYKKWREENKEKMRLYMIEYRKKNKEA